MVIAPVIVIVTIIVIIIIIIFITIMIRKTTARKRLFQTGLLEEERHERGAEHVHPGHWKDFHGFGLGVRGLPEGSMYPNGIYSGP